MHCGFDRDKDMITIGVNLNKKTRGFNHLSSRFPLVSRPQPFEKWALKFTPMMITDMQRVKSKPALNRTTDDFRAGINFALVLEFRSNVNSQ
jgi:hypothetical protein